MTKTLAFFLVALLSVMVIAGCAQHYNKAATGTVLGGALGGLAGSQIGHGTGQTVATVIGTLAGAALGRRVGQSMQRSDRRQLGSALENNQTGRTDTWTNPDTNDQYSVTPTKTYSQGSRPCRQFTMHAKVNGKPDTVTGTACRQPDGTWQVQQT